MSGRHLSAEGRMPVAVTHLALLGVKIAGNGILGFTKENSQKIIYKKIYKRKFTSENSQTKTYKSELTKKVFTKEKSIRYRR